MVAILISHRNCQTTPKMFISAVNGTQHMMWGSDVMDSFIGAPLYRKRSLLWRFSVFAIQSQ